MLCGLPNRHSMDNYCVTTTLQTATLWYCWYMPDGIVPLHLWTATLKQLLCGQSHVRSRVDFGWCWYMADGIVPFYDLHSILCGQILCGKPLSNHYSVNSYSVKSYSVNRYFADSHSTDSVRTSADSVLIYDRWYGLQLWSPLYNLHCNIHSSLPSYRVYHSTYIL